MAKPLSFGGIFDITLGSILRGREAEREIAGIFDNAAAAGTHKGLGKGGKRFISGFEDTWAALLSSGMRKAGNVLLESYEEAERLQRRLHDDLEDLDRKLDGEKDSNQIARLQRERHELDHRIKKEKRAFDRQMKTAKNEAEARAKLVSDYEERSSRTALEKAKEGGETFEGLISKALSPESLDAKGISESIAKALGGGLESAAGGAGAAGATGAAESLAAVAGSVGAVAAPIAALVAVLSSAVNGATDLNKNLMRSATAADIMGESMVKVTGPFGGEIKGLNLRLMMLRRTTLDVANEFNMSTEEVSEAINGMNEAGLTVKEFTGFVRDAANDMDAYAQVTRTAIVGSQALGISSSETGEFMSKLQKDLGNDLDQVQGAFGMIYSEAGKAGMSTKDFFSAINEASSGMALYNFRLGDTVGLYSDMVKILGEDLAKEKSRLEGTFRGMGRTERYKAVMTSGGKASEIVKAEAETSSADFGKKFAGLLGGEGPLAGIAGKEGNVDLQKLSQMSDKQFRAVLHQTSQQDKAAAMQLSNLRDLSQGMDGGLTSTADALGALGKGGELALQLSQANAILGKPLSELKGLSAAAFEEITGYSGDQYEVLKRLDQGLRGEFEALQASGQLQGETFESALTKGLLSQSGQLEEASETQYSLAERAAQDQLEETRSLTQTMQNTVASILENIWLGIEALNAMFGGWLGNQGDTLSARQESFKVEDALNKTLEGLGSKINDEKGKLLSENDAEKRKVIKEEIAALEAEAATTRDKLSGEKSYRRELLGGKSADDARSSVASSGFEEKFGMSPAKFAESMGLSAQSDTVGLADRLTVSGGASGGATYQNGQHFAEGKTADDVVRQKLMSGEMSPEEATEMGFKVAVGPLEKLSAEQIEKLSAEAEKTRIQTQKEAETQAKLGEEQVKGLDGIEDKLSNEQMAKLLAATGATREDLDKAMQEGSGADIVDLVRSRVSSGSATESEGREALAYAGLDYGSPVNDFIYRGDGSGSGEITPINKMDQFFGAKPGGPISQAGGNKTVQIAINGGDEARIYAVIKKVLTDTGYSDLRSY